jgi:hypothetical protein
VSRLLPCVSIIGALAACTATATSSGDGTGAPAGAGDDAKPATPPGEAPAPPPVGIDGGSEAAKPVTYTSQKLGFDELASGTTVTNQYAKTTTATFSSDPGCSLEVTSAAGVAASKPNYLFTYYTCATGPSASMFIDFAKPVKNVSFSLVGVNSSTKCATARWVKKDGTKTTADVIGKGNYMDPVVVTSTATDVVRLEIVDVNDAYGLGLDDVSFDSPDE